MERSQSFWVASHITGMFEICDQAELEENIGSRGAGFSINRGVTTYAELTSSREPVEILFDGKTVSSARVTEEVLRQLGLDKENGLKVLHQFEVPLGAGFSASASGALGASFALNDLFDLDYPRELLFKVAHNAEVITRCGLGDIIALWQGGYEIRVKPGAPGIGMTIPMEDNAEEYYIATTSFGEIETAKVLNDPISRERITNLGNELLGDLLQEPTVDHFGELVEEFTLEVGLATDRILNMVRNHDSGFYAGMIMIGDGMFFIGEDPEVFPSDLPLTMEQVTHETVRVIEEE